LWFCEGVTNTYAELALLRAGLIDRNGLYGRVAGSIQVLDGHAARRLQSAEMSGREAWLEKYSDYNRSQRSVSYYNKGELLGYLLDLGIRHASQNQAGLDDVMRRLNQEFARRGRFYTAADLTAIVAHLAPSFDMNRFLAEDVRGTQELDYATYLGYAGLRLATHTTEIPMPGFSASRNAGGWLEVDGVDTDSDAERAGLQVGDVLMMADKVPVPTGAEAALPSWRPGQAVQLQVTRGGESRVVKFRVGVNQETSFQIEQDAQASPAQLQVREGWLTGVNNSSSGKP
jgi:predicted metalloprotease with PDZ domain